MFPAPSDLPTALIDIAIVALVFLALNRLLKPGRAADRIVYTALAGAILAAYTAWRWLATLPSFEGSISVLWMYLFFAFEAVAILYTLGSMVILLRNKDRSLEADAAQARRATSDDWPAVDIFICTYNEPLEVVEKSILTALAVDTITKRFGFSTTPDGPGSRNIVSALAPAI